MTITAVQKSILDPFTEETLHCLQEMVGTDSHPGEAFEDELEKFRFKGYAVAADVDGERGKGTILIHFYPETALKIGNDLLKKMSGGDVPPKGDIDQDIEDALAEWGNTVVGLATRSVADNDPNVQFEPPYFVRNTEDMDNLLEDVQEVITIPVHTDQAGRFYFNYLLHNKTGAA